MIYHIATRADWERAQNHGAYRHSSLENEGFIHCSTKEQVVQTANNFFKGQTQLLLLQIDEDQLSSECKYEDPAGKGTHDPKHGLLFPHVYGEINLKAVVAVFDFESDENGEFTLPPNLD